MAIMPSPDRLSKPVLRRTFQLTSRPRRDAEPVKPNIVRTVDHCMALRRWDERTVRNLERAVEHWHSVYACRLENLNQWDQFDGGPTWKQEEAAIESAESAIKEWLRIRDAKPLPSTAWLNRQSRIGSREDRAVAIYKRIRAATDDRIRQGEAKMRPFKTYKAQQNERRRVLGADPMLTRLDRYEAMLARYVPDIRNLASPKPWRYN